MLAAHGASGTIPSVTMEQFLQEGDLKKIGEGYQVRVVANPKFPHHVVKEYNCNRSDLKYLFDNEVSALKRIATRLQDEKLSRVVFPQLHESSMKGSLLFEMFPRIYPPNGEEMIGLIFSKEAYRVDGRYYQAGRGHLCEPQHLEKYFHEEVPQILQELGKAFALLHFKAFVICRDVEIVIGKTAPSEPLKLFIIDFDRAVADEIFDREKFVTTHSCSPAEYFKLLYSLTESDVFRDFAKVDEKYKKTFIKGYLAAAQALGFQNEAQAIVTKLQ